MRTVVNYWVGQQVAFPTNEDTIADGVAGHVGVVLRFSPNGQRLVIGVEHEEYVCDPTDIYPVD